MRDTVLLYARLYASMLTDQSHVFTVQKTLEIRMQHSELNSLELVTHSEPLKLCTTLSGHTFLTKMLESNILYDNFLIDILSV